MKGAPVFYKRKFIAICECDTDDTFIRCLDAHHFSRQVFDNFIVNSVEAIMKKLEKLEKTVEDSSSRRIFIKTVETQLSLSYQMLAFSQARRNL